MIDRGELALTSVRPTTEQAWRPVELPDSWGLARRRQTVEGWYRFRVPADAPTRHGWGPDMRVGILLPRAGLNAELFVNGTSFGSHGSMTPPVARNLGNARFFAVPASLWRQGDNELLLHLVTTPGVATQLRPLVIGPEALVHPQFARLEFLHTTLPVAFGVTALLTAFALLVQGLSAAGPSPSTPLGFAIGLVALSYLSGSLRDVPLPSRVFEWTVTTMSCGAALPLVVWTVRHFGLERPRLIRAMSLLWVGFAVLLAVVPPLAAFAVTVSWFVGAMITGLLVIGTFVRRGRWRESWSARLGLGLGTASLGLLVVIFLLAARPLHPIWSPADLTPPLVALGAVVFAGAQLTRAMRTTESLNRELEARVAEREGALARSHAQLRDLEKARAISQERERMTRDLHDGTGGLLVSALTMLRGGRATPGEIEETLQGALDDLRVSIESVAPEGRDLPAVLGLLRARLARQAQQRDMRLEWQVGSVGEDVPLAPSDAMHVTRIVQEAVTNAVRHSGGRCVRVRSADAAGATTDGWVLEVADDGRGGVRSRPGGRGLPNLEKRAKELGGVLRLHSDPDGTVVRLEVPAAETEGSERD